MKSSTFTLAADALRDLAHAQRIGSLDTSGQYSPADLEECAAELERHSPTKLTPCAERVPTLDDADLDGRVWAENGSTGTIARYSYDTVAEHWEPLGLTGWAPTGFTFPAELESLGPGKQIDVERPQLLCKMPRELTAENGAKFLMIGEYQETLELTCLECQPEDEDCEQCDGTGLIYVPVPVQWDTIKRMYARLVQHFAGGEPTL